ncbi:hypothetical protein SY87_29850, partial [Burkholderia pseudomallei]
PAQRTRVHEMHAGEAEAAAEAVIRANDGGQVTSRGRGMPAGGAGGGWDRRRRRSSRAGRWSDRRDCAARVVGGEAVRR